MDGTLIDSVDLHAQAWQETFEHFGYQIPFSNIRSQIGQGGDQLLPVFLSKEEIEEKKEQLDEFRSSLFKKKFLPQVKPLPGVRELFQKIRSSGQQVGLASSAKGDELKTHKRIANIEDLVDVETSSADAEKSKPHPDIFEAALSKLKGDVKRESVVIVGDSPHDGVAAVKAGILIAGVLCGGFSEAELRESGCKAIFQGPEDLLRRYDESPLSKQNSAATVA